MKLLISTLLVAAALALAACNVTAPQGQASPTVEAVTSPTQPTEMAQVAITPDDTATATLPSDPLLESPTPSPTAGPPTATYTPTETPGPIVHTISQGETLGYIIQLYGYTDLSVIDAIVAMNPNLPNADRLPGAGAQIFIPRPTATATPEGFEPSDTPENAPAISPDAQVMQHTVGEGETIVGIAGQYETTLPVLDQLNPELIFQGCDFSNPSGGPECNVQLSVGQLINVPQPTPTPTLSPTPSGSETPTPTPTYGAPMAVFPPEGATASGSSIQLQWVSIGVLPRDYYYLVEVEDTTTGAMFFNVTRNTSFAVSGDIVPTDGQTHAMRWRIRIGERTESGSFRPISAEAAWRTFQWRG